MSVQMHGVFVNLAAVYPNNYFESLERTETHLSGFGVNQELADFWS
jgi:hypothetical protein